MTTPHIFCAIFHLAAHDAPQDMVLILLPLYFAFDLFLFNNFGFPGPH
jgi:hypothetical protein